MSKASDISVRQVGPKTAKKAIGKAIQKRRPVFLWGPPGIGKSDIVKQIGDDAGRQVIDVRLALWEPTDIKGIPYYNAEQGKMVWAPPAELPTDADSTAIIFLDELNSAAPAVQAAAYQLIQNRRVGTYELPKGVDVVAAGNRDGDRGVTYRMPAPLANRFVHLEAKVDFDDWQDWATLNKIHPEVVGYVGFAKQDLYDFDSKSASKAFATPRSWSFVSDLLADESLDEETLFTLVAGAVGEGLAAKFKTHRKFVGKMPQPADILSGKVTDLAVKEISAMYALTTGMCYELRDAKNSKDVSKDQLTEMMGNFLAFMMANFETELVIMGSKIAIKTYEIPIDTTKLKNFNEFYQKYGKFIRDAAVK